jgi:single-strand DNA-binding protein
VRAISSGSWAPPLLLPAEAGSSHSELCFSLLIPSGPRQSYAISDFTFRAPPCYLRRGLVSGRQGAWSMSVNKVMLVGRLGRDPEMRYTSAGQAVCNFSLATDETYKDRNGERQKRTEWHKIVVWAKQAEIAQQYLKKGSLVFVEGRIQSRQWDDKEGQKRTSYEIVCNNFRMLGGRGDSQAGIGPGVSADAEPAAPSDDVAAPAPEISDEDIPF